jgi:hypothetical protein
MLYVGIDLHKRTITICVVEQDRSLLRRKTLLCAEPDKIRERELLRKHPPQMAIRGRLGWVSGIFYFGVQ